jgi:hypothetical protein
MGGSGLVLTFDYQQLFQSLPRELTLSFVELNGVISTMFSCIYISGSVWRLRGRAAPQRHVRRSEINGGSMEKCVPSVAIRYNQLFC